MCSWRVYEVTHDDSAGRMIAAEAYSWVVCLHVTCKHSLITCAVPLEWHLK